jgi:SAM-dependent methyltransferase
VLEIGASKLVLAPFLALHYGVEVHAVDPDPVVDLQNRWITRLGRGDLIDSGRFVVSRQDARALDYPSEFFDRIVAVSTVEHIEDVEQAVAEIRRVLTAGGIAVLSVPFSRLRRKVFVDTAVYDRPYRGTPLFYEHIFDHRSLEERIVRPSGLSVRQVAFLGEPGFKMTRLVYHPVLGPLLGLFRWIWPWTAARWYREITEDQVSDTTENIAVVVLEKAGASLPSRRT